MKYVTTVILMLQKEETEAQESWLSSVQLLSRVRLFATPRTVAYQPPLSMGFSRQEYWSGLPFQLVKNQPAMKEALI